MAKVDLTAQRLRDVLDYDQETGLFTRRFGGPRHKAGATVGALHHSGYILICVDGVRTGAHRMAWLYVTGQWPRNFIDHINGQRGDNSFGNLRDVDRSTNNQNQRCAQRSNKSCGLLGVTWDKPRGTKRGAWLARISHNGKRTGLGRFQSADEAYAAYLDAKLRIHGICLTGRPLGREQNGPEVAESQDRPESARRFPAAE